MWQSLVVGNAQWRALATSKHSMRSWLEFGAQWQVSSLGTRSRVCGAALKIQTLDEGWNTLMTTLETTRGQIDGFFGQLPFKCYLPEVASVGD